MLHCGRAAGNSYRGIQEPLLPCVLINAAQQSGPKEIRVVDQIPKAWDWIAVTGGRLSVSPIEHVLDVLGRACRHAQTPFVLALLIGVQKRVAHERCAHQVRCSRRYDDGASLPRQTVAPAPVRNSLRPKRGQSLDHRLDQLPGFRHSGSRELEECRQKQSDGFGILGFWNTQKPADVHWAALQSLRQNQPRKSRVKERQSGKDTAVYSVEWIISRPIVGLTIGHKPLDLVLQMRFL